MTEMTTLVQAREDLSRHGLGLLGAVLIVAAYQDYVFAPAGTVFSLVRDSVRAG